MANISAFVDGVNLCPWNDFIRIIVEVDSLHISCRTDAAMPPMQRKVKTKFLHFNLTSYEIVQFYLS